MRQTMQSGAPPTSVPTPLPEFGSGQMFLVTSGSCRVVDYCVQSPNFPFHYGANGHCGIAVYNVRDESLVVSHFDVEDPFDVLVVDDTAYTGTAGPDGVRPTGSMRWSSDSLVQGTGWRICPESRPPGPTGAPAPTLALALEATNVECGVKGVDDTPFITSRSGQDATPCEWNWQVLVKIGSNQLCGGTLLSSRWVVTSAHCIGDPTNPDIRVMAGEFDLSSASDASGTVFEVARVVVHPNYASGTYDRDLAMVELATDASLGSCIGTACLPDSEDIPYGRRCLITGWGRFSSLGERPSRLQEAEVVVVGTSACREQYGNAEPSVAISDNMLCAQGKATGNSTASACQGDLGGPLVCENSDGRYELHGVASFGWGCGEENYPVVWARVGKVLSWIHETLSTTPAPTPPPTPEPPWSTSEIWRSQRRISKWRTTSTLSGSTACVSLEGLVRPAWRRPARSCGLQTTPSKTQDGDCAHPCRPPRLLLRHLRHRLRRATISFHQGRTSGTTQGAPSTTASGTAPTRAPALSSGRAQTWRTSTRRPARRAALAGRAARASRETPWTRTATAASSDTRSLDSAAFTTIQISPPTWCAANVVVEISPV
jgi:hypothetical protein